MKRKISIISIIFLIVLILINTNVFAATGSFQVSAKSKSLTVGSTTTLSITAKECAGVFTVKSSDSSIVSVGSVPDWIEEETKTVTLTAKKAGTAKITITASDVGDTDAEAVTGSKTIDITVKAKETTTTDKNTTTNNTSSDKDTTTTKPKEKSNNAYLKTLGVRITDSLAKELGVKTDEYDFSGFSKTKTSYNVTVPKNVDSLKVVATAADSNATVKVNGNSGFEVGSNNKITIKVTAEDGKATKTYTIKVTQLAEEEEKPGNLIEEETELYLTSLSVGNLELSPEFAKDTYSYTATLADSEVTELNVKAVANSEEAKIDISGNTELVEGENTINIVLTLENTTEQIVYQVVVTKEAAMVSTTTSTENTPSSTTDLIGTIKNYAVIAIAVIILMIVAVIVLVILLRRENKRLNEDEQYEEDIEETKTEEYNVYKNDENEFENKDIERDNFIESLYKQRNGSFDDEELDEQEKETLEEISKQTAEIFKEKEVEMQGQSVEYSTELYEENPLEIRRKRRGKGKHSL